MNCEGCPVMHGQGCPKASPITEDSSKVRCPVTPADMTIINAMIRGETTTKISEGVSWRDETEQIEECVAHEVVWLEWQPKEGGE